MNRLSRVSLVALFASGLMCAGAASAQDVTVGYQFQRLEDLNFPVGVGFDASLPINDSISVVGQFDWSRKTESETVFGTSVKASANLATFGGGIRWTAPGVSARPFVQGLVGAMRASANCKVGGLDCSDFVGDLDTSATNFMVQFGGGLAIPISASTDGVAQIDYRRAFADGGGANDVRFLVGVRFGLR